MRTADFYSQLATADLDADLEALTRLSTGREHPMEGRFYAANKASAIQCRLKGDIQRATRFEAAAEVNYKLIPKRYRW